MDITTTIEGTTTTLALDGWLDSATSSDLATALSEIDPSCEALIIDFEKLEYISSAGLRQLVVAHRQMKGNLTICNVSAEVMQLLNMSGFSKRLKIV